MAYKLYLPHPVSFRTSLTNSSYLSRKFRGLLRNIIGTIELDRGRLVDTGGGTVAFLRSVNPDTHYTIHLSGWHPIPETVIRNFGVIFSSLIEIDSVVLFTACNFPQGSEKIGYRVMRGDIRRLYFPACIKLENGVYVRIDSDFAVKHLGRDEGKRRGKVTTRRLRVGGR